MSEKNRIVNYRKSMIIPLGIDEYTKVMLHFDDDSDPFKDERGNTWTATGKPTIATNNAKFGKALQLNENHLQTNNTVNLGGRDFTIDFWCYLSSSSGSYPTAFCIAPDLNSVINRLKAGTTSGSSGAFYFSGVIDNNAIPMLTSTTNVLNKLVHSAYVYEHSKDKITLYINGIQEATANTTIPRMNWYCELGREANSSPVVDGFVGSIDELRISDGIARWTGNFTPPTEPYKLVPVESSVEEQIKFYSIPAEPPRLVLNGKDHSHTYAALVEPTLTQLKVQTSVTPLALLHFDDENNPFKDEIGNAWTGKGTLTDNAKFGKALIGGDISEATLDLNDKSWTIDFWVYLVAPNGWFCEFGTWRIGCDGTYGLFPECVHAGGSHDRFSTGSLPLNEWLHFALVYQHGIHTFSLYANGQKKVTFDQVQAENLVARDPVKYGFPGICKEQGSALYTYDAGTGIRFYPGDNLLIDDLRITPAAIWTSDFDPEEYEEIDNPIASDLRVRIGTNEDDVKAVAKYKYTPTLTLSKTSIVLSASHLAESFAVITNSDGKVSAWSNNPDVVKVTVYEGAAKSIKVTAVSDSGSAIISVQIAESATFEESQIATCVVGNYIFGALNTCTPTEIQVCAQLGIAPATWSVGDDTADIPIAKFAVGGRVDKVWVKSNPYSPGYWTYPVYYYNCAAAPNGHAKIIGFNHNSSYEGNNTIHFMYWGDTWLEPFVDKKNYGEVCEFDEHTDIKQAYKFSYTHHKAKTTVDKEGNITSSTGTNNSGWEGSIIRKKFLPSFRNAMPAEWVNVMAKCTKYTWNNVYDDTHPDGVSSTTGKLFILSEYELFGLVPSQAANENEYFYQQKYDYFATGIFAPTGYRWVDGEMKTTAYWLRSPASKDGTTKYCCVAETGVEEVKGSRVSLGIVPCFVIA